MNLLIFILYKNNNIKSIYLFYHPSYNTINIHNTNNINKINSHYNIISIQIPY